MRFLIASFPGLNLLIDVVVGSIQSRIQVESAEENTGDAELQEGLSALRRELRTLREILERRH